MGCVMYDFVDGYPKAYVEEVLDDWQVICVSYYFIIIIIIQGIKFKAKANNCLQGFCKP